MSFINATSGDIIIVKSPKPSSVFFSCSARYIKEYAAAATMTGETSQIVRDEIKRDIAAGKYHMLYIAPEMLLSRSSIEQLIGNRTIGMIVIDEAHIVTTWGKQFRPDYWFLGDHIRKLRKISNRLRDVHLLLRLLRQRQFITALRICIQRHVTVCI